MTHSLPFFFEACSEDEIPGLRYIQPKVSSTLNFKHGTSNFLEFMHSNWQQGTGNRQLKQLST
jgi:hypothetical protein